jgi:hypothetical protein
MVLRKVFLWVFSISLICMNRLDPIPDGSEQ